MLDHSARRVRVVEIYSFEREEIVANGLWLLRTIIARPYFFLLDPRFLSESGSFYGESKLGNLGKSGTEAAPKPEARQPLLLHPTL